MQILDIQYEIELSKAKQSINNIDDLNKLSFEILNDVKNDGAERYRFWFKKLKKLHPLVDYYLSGRFDTQPISDVVGEHILNVSPDTQSVDLKYYYEKVKSGGQEKINPLQPLPIRNSVRNKISAQQLSMCENAYTELNEAYSIIMSTFFVDSSNESGGDPNNWVITRNIAHEFYNTQDYFGFNVKLLIYDSQFQTLFAKYEDKLQLIDMITPITEKIIVPYQKIIITVEGKKILIDSLGNKIIKMPSEIDDSALRPKQLT